MLHAGVFPIVHFKELVASGMVSEDEVEDLVMTKTKTSLVDVLDFIRDNLKED